MTVYRRTRHDHLDADRDGMGADAVFSVFGGQRLEQTVGREETMNHQELPGQIGFDGITQEDRVYQNAVERVRLAHEVAKGEKLYVAFSGGKDSTVLWGIVCDAARADGIPVEQYAQRHYNITGMDPPELIYHMRENCPDLQWDMYDTSFWRLVVRKGPPTRIARWCCAELKERGGTGCVCCTGVRWAESVRRAATRGPVEVPGSKKARMLFNELKAGAFAGAPYFKECSWGMSHDYPVALEEGSTLIRVGSKIFGERVY